MSQSEVKQKLLYFTTMLGNIRLLVQLRWVAIGFQFIALAIAIALHLPVNINLFLFGLGIQTVVNVVTLGHYKNSSHWPEKYIFFQLSLDVFALNIFVMAGGGLANPFSGLFLIQAIVASMFLTQYRLWIMILATCGSYTYLLMGFNPTSENHHLWMAFHIQGMVINHLMTTLVVGYFLTKIVRNLKLKEQQLSARHSLIGAGATAAQIAHKLGSPLNTMALIAQDLPDNCSSTPSDKEILITEIKRCKEHISDLFHRLYRVNAQEENTLLHPALTLFFQEASKRYPHLAFSWHLTSNRLIRSISTELIILILDILVENAVEAGANTVSMEGLFDRHVFQLTIQNNGPPLPDDIQRLMQAGFSAHKDSYHTGMGLFLARLMMDHLAAKVEVIQDSGVTLKLTFPLDILCAH